jgi:hypothetical protein
MRLMHPLLHFLVDQSQHRTGVAEARTRRGFTRILILNTTQAMRIHTLLILATDIRTMLTLIRSPIIRRIKATQERGMHTLVLINGQALLVVVGKLQDMLKKRTVTLRIVRAAGEADWLEPLEALGIGYNLHH